MREYTEQSYLLILGLSFRNNELKLKNIYNRAYPKIIHCLQGSPLFCFFRNFIDLEHPPRFFGVTV